jgi:hypothetical protein
MKEFCKKRLAVSKNKSQSIHLHFNMSSTTQSSAVTFLKLRFAALFCLTLGLTSCTTTSPITSTMATAKPTDFIVCNLNSESGSFKGSCDVTCSVNALAINFAGIEPKRACSGALRNVKADIAKTAVSGKWLGTMQGVQPEDPTRFELVANADARSSVARTPFGWFAVRQMKESGDTLVIEIDAHQQVRPTANDIAIIARASQKLPNEAVWNKNDNRQCPTGQAKISLFCALQNATTEVSGGIHYRQPALQAVREVLNTVDPTRIKTHRIMDFNNHPDTTLAEIHSLLKRAQVLLEKDI